MPAVRKNKERDNLKSAYNLVMNEDYVEKANKSQDQMENIMDVRLDIRNNVVTLLCLTNGFHFYMSLCGNKSVIDHR